jgi:hypothetical protein
VLSRVHSWSYVLFLCAGFIVPAAFALALDATSMPFYMTSMFGPYVVMVVAVWAYVRLDKRSGGRMARQDAPPPKTFVRLLVLLCWAYLLCLEAVLMLTVQTKGVFGGGGTLVAAFIGYLPVRLCIAISDGAMGHELAFVGVAFLHFLYRLAAAAG